MRRLLASLTAAVLLTVGVVTSGPAVASADESTVSLSGVVSDASGAAVPGIQLKATAVSSASETVVYTDGLGHYELNGLTRYLRYKLSVDLPYVVQQPNVYVYEDEVLNLSVDWDSPIRGKAVDFAGHPVVGMTVRLASGDVDCDYDCEEVTYASTFTDANGTFLFEGLLPDRHLLYFDVDPATGLAPIKKFVPAGSGARTVDVVLEKPLVATTAPQLTGECKYGSQISVSSGAWNADVSISYRWYTFRDYSEGDGYTPDIDIPGANTSQVVIPNEGLLDNIAVELTVTAPNYLMTTVSRGCGLELGDPAVLVAPPTITGEASVGSTITATPGVWSGDSGSYIFYWAAGSTQISAKRNDGSLVVPSSAFGKKLTLKVYSTPLPNHISANQSLTVVTNSVTTGPAPASLVAPKITGTVEVGNTLGVDPGRWSVPDPTYSYAWLVSGKPVSTDAHYTLKPADLAKGIVVTVTTSTAHMEPGTATSPVRLVRVGAAPVNTAIPTIGGTAEVGRILSVGTGNWTGVERQYSYQWLREGTSIAGETASSHIVTTADAGKKLTVKITTSAPGYTSATIETAPTATVVKAAAPVNTAKPTITGGTSVGSILTATSGTWSRGSLTYTYQWLRGGSAISGATSATYTASAGDVDKTLSVRVTTSSATYLPASAVSSSTAVIVKGTSPKAVTAPKITGAAAVGQTLTATAGTWNATGLSYTYQWARSGTNISGATTLSYTLQSADFAKQLTVTITTHRDGYYTASARSAATSIVLGAAPKTTTRPGISGAPQVGKTLTASAGTWNTSGLTYTYQWLRGGTAISGATNQTYVLTTADYGKTITVTVTAKRSGYVTGTATSAPAGTIQPAAAPTNQVAPKISGTAKVGATLTAAPGTWSVTGLSYTYQWKRNGATINGATAATYKLAAADKGKSITVTVTAKRTGYESISATSAKTGLIS